MPPERRLEYRVGLLLFAALAAIATTVFLIGRKEGLFTRQVSYRVRFANVVGLRPDSGVQLSGVEVGRVDEIVLPADIHGGLLEVRISLDARYRDRVRADSIARIKTLGLLGNKYLEITSGSPAAQPVPPGGEIQAAEPTNVDRLVASGEDVVANVVSISHSLAAILERMESGEGVLGQLTQPLPSGRNVGEEAVSALASVREMADSIDRGRGAFHQLVHDRAFAARLNGAVERLDALLAKAEGGEGLLPALLSDPAAKARFDGTLAKLEASSDALAAVTAELRAGHGLLGRAIGDDEWGEAMAVDLAEAVRSLRAVAAKLERGDGTAARLLEDPSLYEAMNDIVIGVNESKLLRWLIRNRQRAGFEKRYRDARGGAGVEPEPTPTPSAAPAPAPLSTPPPGSGPGTR